MLQAILKRELKLKNFEVFIIKNGYYGDTICYMLLIDLRRPSTLEDYPYLKEIETVEEFGRSNFIKAIFLHDNEINNDLKEYLVNIIAGGFLENKDDCDWNADFEKINTKIFRKIEEDRRYMLSECSKILLKYGSKYNFNDLKDENFNYLSQD